MFESSIHHSLRIAGLIVACGLAAGCFAPGSGGAVDDDTQTLTAEVRTALAGQPDVALRYAGLYAVLADRFEAGRFETTGEAAAIAQRAADIVGLPGSLRSIVGRRLDPLLSQPKAVTPELATQAAVVLRELSNACR